MEESYIARASGITLRDKIGYAMGDVGSLLVFGLVQSVLQKYYTDVAGLAIVDVMLLFIFARVWDAINDPIWGGIIDKAGPSRKGTGRYRRWILYFAVPTALSAVLMFVRLPGASAHTQFIWACVTYVVFGMLYTCINIPYGSLAQVITADEQERSSLSVFRSVGSTFGALPAMLLVSFCYVKNADGTSSMSYQKIITGVSLIAVLSIVAYLACYFFTKERVAPPPPKKAEKGATLRTAVQLFASRPFLMVCLAGMLFLAGQMFSQSYYPYLFNYYFNAPQFSMLPIVCQYLPVVVFLPIIGKLGKRFGRRDVCAYGMLFSGICNLVLYLSGAASVWGFLAVNLLTGFGNAAIFLLVWALVTDALDYNQITLGIQDEATGYALFSFMRKLGQTVAAILVNSALLRIGYTDNVLNTGAITAGTLGQMYAFSVLIPAILYLLIFAILRFAYPLGKQQVADLRVQKEAYLKNASRQGQ